MLSKKLIVLLLAIIYTNGAYAVDNELYKAKTLYDKALYAQAMEVLQMSEDYGSDPLIDGYVALCAMKQKSPGYLNVATDYVKRYQGSVLYDKVCLEMAFDYFGRSQYGEALEYFNSVDQEMIPELLVPEFTFKRGYCYYVKPDKEKASYEFRKISRMTENDYSAPAMYLRGYMAYTDGDFDSALNLFKESGQDERFTSISNFYIISCKYEQKDYDFVLDSGVDMFLDKKVPENCREKMARMISESYLIKGDLKSAREYYDASGQKEKTSLTRSDYFYAGSLMFATSDWKSAIENYSNIVDKSDSLGQIAYYQTALSYLNLKNKIGALDAFKMACQSDFDPIMTEDAFFNYAKLAFDLNGETSVFHDYMKRYSDKARGEKIYSYMALAALAERNYQAAIDAYDNIEMLDGQNRSNYVRANFLRGAELLEHGSYRKSIQCFNSALFYSPKNDPEHQLSRYCLAEALYRNGQYAEAQKEYATLYNTSALYGSEQARLVPYYLAYTYLKDGQYEKAVKWFDTYCKDGKVTYRKDALLRKADCLFANKDYSSASNAYQDVIDEYYDKNDIYPYYRCALACGLNKNLKKKLELLKNVEQADTAAKYYPEACFELGKAYLALKKVAEAENVMRNLSENIKRGDYPVKATLELGTIYRNAKRVDDAVSRYKEVVRRMPDSEYANDALLALESIYQHLNKPHQYLAYLDEIGRGGTKSESEKETMCFNAAEELFYSSAYPEAISSFNDFKNAFPGSDKIAKADLYIAETYRLTGDKEKACDIYKAILDCKDSTVLADALTEYAPLAESMENYEDAYAAYSRLSEINSNNTSAWLGSMRSAYKLRNYSSAISIAQYLEQYAKLQGKIMRDVKMIHAKSLIASGKRENALPLMSILAKEPKTAEGAEATVFIIQDLYDKAEYDAVQVKVFAFSDSGTGQEYWLAKAFLILGDCYAEQGKLKQAKATFESIKAGYTKDMTLNDEIDMRLSKLSSLNADNQ